MNQKIKLLRIVSNAPRSAFRIAGLRIGSPALFFGLSRLVLRHRLPLPLVPNA